MLYRSRETHAERGTLAQVSARVAVRRPIQSAPAPTGRSATAAYVSAMTAEMAALARRDRLDMLAYMLDMVRMEAEATAQAETPPRAQISATSPAA